MRRLLLVAACWGLLVSTAQAHVTPNHVDQVLPRFTSATLSAAGLPGACLTTDSAGHADQGTGQNQTKLIYVHRASRPDASLGWSPWINQASKMMQRHLARASNYQKGLRFDLTDACGGQRIDLPVGVLDSTATDAYELFDQLQQAFSGWSRADADDNIQILFDGGTQAEIAGLASLHQPETPDGSEFSVVFLPGLGKDGSNPWEEFLAFAMLHETLHNLGAVSLASPHSDAGGHSSQGDDIMFVSQWIDIRQEDPSDDCFTEELLAPIDCGSDDYFSPSPTPGLMSTPGVNTFLSTMLADCAELGCQRAAMEKTAIDRMRVDRAQKRFYVRIKSDALSSEQADARAQIQGRRGKRWQLRQQAVWKAVLEDDGGNRYFSLLPRLRPSGKYRIRAIVQSGNERITSRWTYFQAR